MKREVAGFPQPPLGHSALTKEVQENRDEFSVCCRNDTVVLCCWRPVDSSCSVIYQQFNSTGISLVVSINKYNYLNNLNKLLFNIIIKYYLNKYNKVSSFFLTPQSKSLYELKSSLLTKPSFSEQSRNQTIHGATPGAVANNCSTILSLSFCVIFSMLGSKHTSSCSSGPLPPFLFAPLPTLLLLSRTDTWSQPELYADLPALSEVLLLSFPQKFVFSRYRYVHIKYITWISR